MPLEVLRECNGAFVAQLPPDLQCIKLGKLQMGQDCADRFVQGAVFLRYPPHQLGTMEKVIKLVLEESSEDPLGSKQINVFLFGPLVDKCEPALQQGITVALAAFEVSHSPTFHKDGRHPLQLELSEQTGARVFVYERTVEGPPVRGAPPVTGANVPIVQRTKDYVYVPLNQVKDGLTVNVYGVVKFFKLPVPSKGTDYYSTLTLIDQSAAQLHCVLFSGNLNLLPKIYKVGDVVRFHRLKIQLYGNELQGVNAPGFSALTFDGALEAGVTPRTGSRSYQFTSIDRRMVRELRSWARASLPGVDTLRLKDIQPNTKYLDLTCQLLAKARIETSSVLLKVWDGTKCPQPVWQVDVDRHKLEGDASAIESLRGLSVDVLLYDNHASTASNLQVGTYLRLHNIHLKSPAGNEVTELHLHGGTSYGRGVSVLPANSHDSEWLKRSLEAVVRDDEDSLGHLSLVEAAPLGEAICQPTNNCQKTKDTSKPEQRCQEESATVLTAHQHITATALGDVLSQEPPRKYRIRAQLVDFEPRGLHQSVKLHCPACQAWLEIPYREDVDAVLSSAPDLLPGLDLCPAPWYQTVTWHLLSPDQVMAVHIILANEGGVPESKAILAEGVTVQELHRLSGRFGSVIPVCRSSEQLMLMDFSVPFVIEGRKWHYGCKNCSTPRPVDALRSLPSGEPWEASAIARGVQMMHYVFVMKLTLSDGSGSLEAVLWDEAVSAMWKPIAVHHMWKSITMCKKLLCASNNNFDLYSALQARQRLKDLKRIKTDRVPFTYIWKFIEDLPHLEKFFGFSASDVVVDESLQEKLTRILETLCPSTQSPEGCPWLECCIKSYRVSDGSSDKTCFQMFDTTVVGTEEL